METIAEKKQFGLTDLLMIIVTFMWGLNYVIVKIPLQEMSPLLLTSLRFIMGSIVCWLILFYKERNLRVDKRLILYFFITGVMANGLNQLAFIYGVSMTTSGATSIIFASTPACVALISQLLKLEKNNPKTWLGILVSFIGVIVVVSSSGKVFNGGRTALLGSILIVIASIFWSIYTIMLRYYFKDVSVIKVTTYSMTFTALFFILVSFKDILAADYTAFSTEAWLGVVFSGAFVIGISYILWNVGVQRIGATRTSTYAYLPPFVSIIVGSIFLNERISLLQIIGGSIIIIGLVYANRAKNQIKTIEALVD